MYRCGVEIIAVRRLESDKANHLVVVDCHGCVVRRPGCHPLSEGGVPVSWIQGVKVGVRKEPSEGGLPTTDVDV